MNAAHYHLLLNHIPILGTIIGTVLLAYGFFRRQEAVQKVSLGLLVVAGVVAIAVYLTGEGAEDIIEEAVPNAEALIEPHEEAGLIALIAGIATGVVSLLALLLGAARKHLLRWTVTLALVVGLATSGIMGWTAYRGGQINHPEIRTDATTVAPAVPPVENEVEE